MPVTYDETRLWVTWVRIFTQDDLAETMAVEPETLNDFIKGLVRWGTIEDSGDRVNGTERGEEVIWSYIPLPPGPTHHPHGTPPEIIAVNQMGGFEIHSPRGMPVRIRSERDQRKTMSTPGARGRIKRREQRYWAMQKAVRERAAKQKEREAQLLASGVKAGPKRRRRDFIQREG